MRLRSFNSLANAAADKESLPSRIKVFNWGVNKTLKGDVIVNDKTAKVFNANQKAMGRDVIALDYEHNTVPNTTEYERTKEPRMVAAHMIPEVVVGDGIYLSIQDWTDSGKAYAKNYKDLSPAPYTDDEGVLLGLHSVALTQTGAVFDLTFLNTIGTPIEADLVALSTAMGIETPDAYKLALKNRPSQFQNNMKDEIKIFRTAMAMGDDKSDEEVLKCMAMAIKEGKWVRKGPLDDVDGTSNAIHTYVASAIEAVIGAKLTALTGEVSAIKTAAQSAQKAAEETERNGLVAQASREGKVIPLSAEALKTIPNAALKEMISALPKTVPMDGSPMARLKAGETGKIKGGPARQVSLTVQGVPITLNVDGTAVETSPLRGYARAASAFQAQWDSTQTNGTTGN